jgi:hypothetical protein
MRPVTIDGSDSSSSCSHPRKRRPTSSQNLSKDAVRAPSLRYASTNSTCAHSTPVWVDASVFLVWLRKLFSLDSASAARLRARLTAARAAWAYARAFFAPSLSSASRRLRSYFSIFAAVSFSSRLRLLFSTADLSQTAFVCCIRKR